MHSKLDKAYRQESNPDGRERIFLVRRIAEDKQHIVNVAKELHRCRAWAYKWYKRYNEDGLDGLKDKERTGRPPDVPKDVMIKIRQELADSNTGWDFRQVMDLIYNKTGVRYHEVHIYRLLHKWGFKSKVPQKRFVKTASVKDKMKFKKE
ncbi:MAG: helix-turn-helix domain-containing protein [Nitrososphaeraceae archaeon]